MEKIELYTNSINTLIKSTTRKKELLRSEGKEDESLFEKIKINVYEIYLKMIYVSKSQSDFVKTYENFLKKIPENWYASLEVAKNNGDFEKEQVELIKLEAKVEVESEFHKVFGN